MSAVNQKTQMFLVCGDDDYLVSAKAREIVNAIIPERDQLTALEIIEGTASNASEVEEAVGSCKAALSSGGLFSEKKCIWLRTVSFLGPSRAGQSAAAKEAVTGLVEFLKQGMSPDSYLVLSCGKVDKRSALYKLFAASGEICEFGSAKPYEQERDAAAFVQARARELGLSMDRSAVDAFVEKVGTSSRFLAAELEKLSIYMGDKKDVTVADIDAVTSSARTALAWDLADAFGEKNLVRSLKVLRRLLYQNENEVGIIIALELRLRDLMIHREALDKGWLVRRGRGYGWEQVSPEADSFLSGGGMKGDPRKVHPFRVGILAGQAAKFTLRDLRAMMKLTVQAHERLVSSPESKQNILETLVVRLLRNRRKAAAR